MRKFKLISVVLFALVMLFVFAGCNNKEDSKEDLQLTTASDVEVDSTASTSAVTEAIQHSTKASQSETTEPIYTPQSDELEILTPDAGNNSGDDTPEPVVTEPDAQENTTAQSTETFPELDDIIDEPIELPFVPIN